MEQKHYKIVRLTAKNFKRLRAVEINPDGSVVVIRGENDAGKSSVIDSIWTALGGKKAMPDKPIREGEERAVITLDMGDLIVTRTFTEKGSTLSVRNPDGMSASDPQRMLDQMLGAVGFDPFDFARLSETAEGRRKQAATLARAIGLDFAEMNAERKIAYDARTEANREVKRFDMLHKTKEQELEGLDESQYAALTSIDEVLTDQRAAQEQHRKHQERVDANSRRLMEIQTIEKAIKELEAKLAAYQNEVSKIRSERASEEQVIIEVSRALPDLAIIETKLRTVNDHNETVRAFAEANSLLAQYREASKQADEHDVKIQKIDLAKKEQIEKAQLPIEGLVFDEDGISVNGIPFEQCSASQKLKVATAIAMKLNPQIRVLRILDGSLLDSKSMAIIQELAEQNDFQVWIEVVDESKDGPGILIEDGMVA